MATENNKVNLLRHIETFLKDNVRFTPSTGAIGTRLAVVEDFIQDQAKQRYVTWEPKDGNQQERLDAIEELLVARAKEVTVPYVTFRAFLDQEAAAELEAQRAAEQERKRQEELAKDPVQRLQHEIDVLEEQLDKVEQEVTKLKAFAQRNGYVG